MGPAGADGVQGVKIEPAFVYGLEPAGSFELRMPSFEKKIGVGGGRFVVTPYAGLRHFFRNFFQIHYIHDFSEIIPPEDVFFSVFSRLFPAWEEEIRTRASPRTGTDW